MEKPSFAAPAVSTKSSDELSVAAGVEAVSLASRGSHECQQEMPPGVGHAPDVQGTASDVVQAEGIPATAEREGQGQRSGHNVDSVRARPTIAAKWRLPAGTPFVSL